MSSVNVTDLRSHLFDYMKRVQAGEEVAITSRGKIVARLVPEYDASEAARKRLAAIWTACANLASELAGYADARCFRSEAARGSERSAGG